MTEAMEFGSRVGRVIRFFNRKGYGFVTDLNDNTDYFVHNSEIQVKDGIYGNCIQVNMCNIIYLNEMENKRSGVRVLWDILC